MIVGKIYAIVRRVRCFQQYWTTHGSKHHRQDCSPHELTLQLVLRVFVKEPKINTSSPLSLSNVRTPFLPVFCPLSIFLQALLFLGEILVVIDFDHGGDLALPIYAGLFPLMLGK
jgi:hypothetical protein